MKKISKSILAGMLCAVIAITSIMAVHTDTAYAASKTPFTLTFKGKTVKLSNDINDSLKNGIKKISVKSLKTKWGKVTKAKDEAGDIYYWEKGKSNISYRIFSEGSEVLTYYLYNKNSGVCGIKIGMKKATVLKKLKKIVGKKNIEYTNYNEGFSVHYVNEDDIFDLPMHIEFSFKNGKLINIYGVADIR